MSHNIKEIPFQPSTIETIDFALYNWLADEMNIHATTNKGWKKVDTIWVSGERSAQVKEKQEERDGEGTLIFPRITLGRTGFVKDPSKKTVVQAHVPNFPDYKGGTFPAAKVIHQLKSSEFANAQAYRESQQRVGHGQINFKTKKIKPPVYITYTMPLPVSVNVNYKVGIRAEYEQQHNEILQPFLAYSGNITSFFIKHEQHKFECFFESDFNQENNLEDMTEEERKFETTFNIRVLGYIMGKGKNDEYPKATMRENAVEFKMPRERVVFQDELNRLTKNGLYRP